MAELDRTWYRGNDLYSDGDEAENTILQIVREGKRLDELEQASWPTFYHLSPLRENICNWYPFLPGSRVLEIGAGCGAVTGALCGQGLQVYSVDLSLRRSTINYERHKDEENLHILVGNLNDMTFPERFDYILLIGVLEYAGKFTAGEDPFGGFLRYIRDLLKPEGKLLIAIENRLGLKYFAGAPEDHLGTPFMGLRGYDAETGIRTFSKSELTALLRRSGFPFCRFYYPYPDYKFPLEIFTDDTLRSQHYGRPYQVFDREHAEIFPEQEIASLLAEEGNVSSLANSFLVETSTNAAGLDRMHVFYAKLNSGRRDKLRIGTKLFGADAPDMVSKYALTEVADAHIQRIAENEKKLSNFRNVLSGSQEGIEIIYPYVAARTMEDEIRDAASCQDADAIIDGFEKILQLASIKAEKIEVVDLPKFQEWFGEKPIPTEDLIWTSPANVDLMPDNVFVNGNELLLSDCEWVTDFPVPVSFLLWRSIEQMWFKVPQMGESITRESLYQRFDIRLENISTFQSWAWHFENVYVSNGSNDRFAKQVRRAAYDPLQAEELAGKVQSQAAHIEQLIASERELNGQVQSQAAHIDQLIASERELNGKVQSQAAHIEQLIASERELNGQVQSQAAHIDQLIASERELKETLQQVYSSKSWQATRVFREAHQKLRGGKSS